MKQYIRDATAKLRSSYFQMSCFHSISMLPIILNIEIILHKGADLETGSAV